MSISDYIFDSLLVLVVLRQVRESRFTLHSMLLPLGIMALVIKSYLRTIPTGGNDLRLIVGLTAVGMVAGTVSALTTRVRADGGKRALVKAGWVAAGVWVLSMAARFAFGVWASHGGGPDLYRFSVAHDLDIKVWTAALVLMALGEVVTRIGIIFYRTRRALATTPRIELEPMTV